MIDAVVFGAACGWTSALVITVYLHRSLTHQALVLHPAAAHPMRFWLWLATGTNTRRWVAVHRRHHAYVDRAGDPHSPAVEGIAKIFFLGYWLYRRATSDDVLVAKYGYGCPDDWLERNVYVRYRGAGLLLLLGVDLALFGPRGGMVAFVVNCLWVPFWAISVINGLCHFVGYRNYDTRDASRNLWPLAIPVAGEELHNNHHRFPRSARFSARAWEIDPGWFAIRTLSALKLVQDVRLPEGPASLDERAAGRSGARSGPIAGGE